MAASDLKLPPIIFTAQEQKDWLLDRMARRLPTDAIFLADATLEAAKLRPNGAVPILEPDEFEALKRLADHRGVFDSWAQLPGEIRARGKIWGPVIDLPLQSLLVTLPQGALGDGIHGSVVAVIVGQQPASSEPAPAAKTPEK